LFSLLLKWPKEKYFCCSHYLIKHWIICLSGLEEGKLSSTNGNASDPPAADAAAQDHSVASMLRNASTLGDSVLLIAALCFHSVFEGIAIGVAGKIIIIFLT
jgi:zinc transporter ZupT